MSGDSSPDSDDEEEFHGLTEGDRERIRAFLEKDEGDRDPNDLVPDRPADENESSGTGDVRGTAAGTCRDMRRRMSDATTVREVMDDYPDKTTSEVMRHVYGDCGHVHDTPPTASPQIGVRECRLFRERYAAGYDVSEISDEFYRADNTVTRHIFGRCSHPNNPRPASVSEVGAEECGRLRRTYVGNEKVSVEGAATAMGLRPEVAGFHLSGYCSCENDASPAAEVEEW